MDSLFDNMPSRHPLNSSGIGPARDPGMKFAALVGVGGHGERHLAAMHVLEGEGLLRLGCVADPFLKSLPGRAAELEQRGGRCYADHRAMLEAERNIDLLVLCTPIPLHEEMVQLALEMSSARILIEKPAVPILSQLDRLIALDAHQRVRVGYQMIFWPQVRRLKQWILDGEHGGIESVIVSAGWSRRDAYYRRTGWAGKMVHEGRPVFDGPATNGLSHLLHNVCFLLGDGEKSFAAPRSVRASLSRARRMESYDTVEMEADFGGVPVRVLLTHAVCPHVPFAIRVLGRKESAGIVEAGVGTSPIGAIAKESFPPMASEKLNMYREFAAEAGDFARMECTLRDCRSVTVWTSAALASSGGIHDIPEEATQAEAEGVVNIPGLSGALRDFPGASPGFERPWAPLGPPAGEENLGVTEAFFNNCASDTHQMAGGCC